MTMLLEQTIAQLQYLSDAEQDQLALKIRELMAVYFQDDAFGASTDPALNKYVDKDGIVNFALLRINSIPMNIPDSADQI